MDETVVEEIYDYFMEESETGDVDTAYRDLQEDDYTLEEIQLVRIKFLSEVAN